MVALVDDNEVTLNRLRRKGKSIALEPANAAFETRIFGPDQVKVQGTLVGLMRSYHWCRRGPARLKPSFNAFAPRSRAGRRGVRPWTGGRMR